MIAGTRAYFPFPDIHQCVGTRMTNKDHRHIVKLSKRAQEQRGTGRPQQLEKLPIAELNNCADRHVVDVSY